MIVKLTRLITDFILRNFYNFKIIGAEKIPPDGKLIAACNHVSNIDPPAVEIAINKVRHARFMVKKELFKVPFVSYIFRRQKYIPLDRYKKGGDLKALRLAVKNISQGHCVVIFPEGTRSKNGIPLQPKLGAGFIAYKTKAPVLCMRIFRSKGFPFTKNMVLKIGNMLKYENMQDDINSKQIYQKFSNKIMSEILSIKESNAQDF
jgi:1-acyl-sn-glycerol-3-phosphate acyltransferase